MDKIGRLLARLILLGEKRLYSEFFWSVYSRIPTEHGPEKLRTRTFLYPPLLSYRDEENKKNVTEIFTFLQKNRTVEN